MKDEALRLALDYIIATNKSSTFWLVPQSELNKTVTAIKQSLAQPEGEPVAWYVFYGNDDEPNWVSWGEKPTDEPNAILRPLVFGDTSTPKREWQGLTDEEQQELYDAWIKIGDGWGSFYALIEAKLKQKNHDPR